VSRCYRNDPGRPPRRRPDSQDVVQRGLDRKRVPPVSPNHRVRAQLSANERSRSRSGPAGPLREPCGAAHTAVRSEVAAVVPRRAPRIGQPNVRAEPVGASPARESGPGETSGAPKLTRSTPPPPGAFWRVKGRKPSAGGHDPGARRRATPTRSGTTRRVVGCALPHRDGRPAWRCR
jgi:hypothetical protein